MTAAGRVFLAQNPETAGSWRIDEPHVVRRVHETVRPNGAPDLGHPFSETPVCIYKSVIMKRG